LAEILLGKGVYAHRFHDVDDDGATVKRGSCHNIPSPRPGKKIVMCDTVAHDYHVLFPDPANFSLSGATG
jgi:hypothetical protein